MFESMSKSSQRQPFQKRCSAPRVFLAVGESGNLHKMRDLRQMKEMSEKLVQKVTFNATRQVNYYLKTKPLYPLDFKYSRP
jgi:hypothetical protein